jgi:hypothetical protein
MIGSFHTLSVGILHVFGRSDLRLKIQAVLCAKSCATSEPHADQHPALLRGLALLDAFASAARFLYSGSLDGLASAARINFWVRANQKNK